MIITSRSQKHKIFLYKEDFEKFADGLKDAVEYIGNEKNDTTGSVQSAENDNGTEKRALASVEFTSIEFDDLGEK